MRSDEPNSEDRTGRVNPDEEVANVEAQEPPTQPEVAAAAQAVDANQPSRSLWAQFVSHLKKPPGPSREMKSTERTRGLVILAGTTIVCIFLFFGLFTTDSSTDRGERRVTPNLGRPKVTDVDPENANRSPVPQLSVDEQPSEDSGELSEQDLLGTMRNRGTPTQAENGPPPPAPTPAPNRGRTLSAVSFDDPALVEAYRRQGLVPPSQSTRVSDFTNATNDVQQRQNAPANPRPLVNPNDALKKSSIVFVRTADETSATRSSPIPALRKRATTLLPQGTALVARLQHAVSSAAKVPVTAVIEYNYEESGQLVVPAGTKAYGELAQATPQGWVTIKFHTLEFPNGQQEAINGSAISMERTALRGDVNGKNGAKKFLTRALTGVGTIAAFAVGGRGLSGSVDNSILLRERLASNVALAGEQEMAMLAYQQNIVVTVPANTRFLLVLNEAGIAQPPDSVPQPATQPVGATLWQTSSQAALSGQEIRELLQLRNELKEMNRLNQLSVPKAGAQTLEHP